MFEVSRHVGGAHIQQQSGANKRSTRSRSRCRRLSARASSRAVSSVSYSRGKYSPAVSPVKPSSLFSTAHLARQHAAALPPRLLHRRLQLAPQRPAQLNTPLTMPHALPSRIQRPALLRSLGRLLREASALPRPPAQRPTILPLPGGPSLADPTRGNAHVASERRGESSASLVRELASARRLSHMEGVFRGSGGLETRALDSGRSK